MISKVGAFLRGMPYNKAGPTRSEQSTVRVCFRIVAIILLETLRDYYAQQRVPRWRRRSYPATDSLSNQSTGLYIDQLPSNSVVNK